MTGDAAELARLAEQVRAWRRPIELAASAPFRLCLRLEEPKPGPQREHDQWRVGYLLQAMDDQSLLVPVKSAWKPSGREAVVLTRDGFQPREFLLSALGQAATVCPRIEQSLKTAAPAGYTVDSRSAHEFLSERAAALEQAGFGVFLPSWWSRKGAKLRLEARAVVKAPSPKMKSSSMLSLDEILSFHWEVSLGDETLTHEELEALAELKSPLVNVRGKWVTLSAEEINAALDFWKQKGDRVISAREAVRMALGPRRHLGRSRSPACRHRAGFRTCWNSFKGPRGLRCWNRRRGSRARSGPINHAVFRGLSFCGGGDSAPVWRTTWGWGRRFRRWRWFSARGNRARRKSASRRC